MAEVSFLHFPEEDQVFFVEHDISLEDISTLETRAFWSHIPGPTTPCRHHHYDDVIFPSISSNRVVGSSIRSEFTDNSNIVVEDRHNQVTFVMDLFQQRVEQSHFVDNTVDFVAESVGDLNFGVIEENFDVGANCLDLELRLGLEEEDDGDDDNDNCNCGGLTEFVVSDCEYDVCIPRSESELKNKDGNDNEIAACSSSRIGGLMMVGIDSDDDDDVNLGNDLLGIHVDSDDDEEDFGLDNVNDDDLSIPLCWDSFQLGEEDESNAGINHEFEWEEVDDDDDRVDEREVLSVVADPEFEGSIFLGMADEVEGRGGREMRNLEWEVLLNVRRNDEMMEYENEEGPYFGDEDDDDVLNTAEYELMFGQFSENENAFLSRPPASKSVVEKLPSVKMTKEDVVDEKGVCAICKDEIEVGEIGKQLPCLHRYHGECIVPWLGIRNTCPVCRYELPTDDAEYEKRRAQTGPPLL